MSTAANDALQEPGPDGYDTVREWLRDALYALLTETEGFSGKRPLGNSGWYFEIEEALAKHGVTITELLDAFARKAK